MAAPIYLNAEISNTNYDEFTLPIKWIDAQTHISKSGAIIERAKDYYASVFRLVLSCDVPVFIAEMQLPSVDGLTLVYSISLRSTIGGVVHRGRAFLKLPYLPADAIPTAVQPTDYYNAFWNYDQVTFALNQAMTTAYANLIANGSTVNAAECPFFSNSPQDKFQLTAYPFNLYEYRYPPSGDRVEIFFNAPSYCLIKGWDAYYPSVEGNPPNAFGEDFQLLMYNDGFNYLPRPAGAVTSIAPAVPATTSLTAVQAFEADLPGIVSIQVLSDLPSAGEFVQSLQSNEVAKILTDFKPDLTTSGGATTQFYNASFGDCRWIKLTGEQPITQLTLSIVAVDYLGVRHPLQLYSKSENASIKICFAPKELVEYEEEKNLD